MKESGKSEVPSFSGGLDKSQESKEIKEIEIRHVKELTQIVNNMKFNDVNQVTSLQNHLISMERYQGNKSQNNRNNNGWQKRGPCNEKICQIDLVLPILLRKLHLIVDLAILFMMKLPSLL